MGVRVRGEGEWGGGTGKVGVDVTVAPGRARYMSTVGLWKETESINSEKEKEGKEEHPLIRRRNKLIRKDIFNWIDTQMSSPLIYENFSHHA